MSWFNIAWYLGHNAQTSTQRCASGLARSIMLAAAMLNISHARHVHMTRLCLQLFNVLLYMRLHHTVANRHIGSSNTLQWY